MRSTFPQEPKNPKTFAVKSREAEFGVEEPDNSEPSIFSREREGHERDTRQAGELQRIISLTGLRVIVTLLLALGLFFRFANLDKKIYWLDEMITSMRVAGYSLNEVKDALSTRPEVTVQDIQKFQHLDTKGTLLRTIDSLLEQPVHPPLYFIMAREWAELFGDSKVAIRSLSGILSLFVFPSLYWLCCELFDSASIASLATMLLAVSPFHVLYAQEARPYSLWILMTVLSSAVLLRAIRLNTVRSWAVYALTVVAGIYSHLFFGLVVLGHAIYVVTLNKAVHQKSSPYLVSTGAAGVFFLPWALAILFGMSRVAKPTEWIRAADVGLLDTLKRWTLAVSAGVMDTGGIYVLKATYGLDTSWIHMIRVPVLLLIGYSLFFICRKASRRVRLFILALLGSATMPLLVADLLFGWRLSTHPRFLTPYYPGALLSLAYLLAAKMASPAALQRRVWKTVTVTIIAAGAVSCAISSAAETWWNKGAANPQLAHVINRSSRPLLIVDTRGPNLVSVASLTSILEPKVRIQGMTGSNKLEVAGDSSDVFLINPSERLRQIVESKGYRIEAAYDRELWRLTKQPQAGERSSSLPRDPEKCC